MEKEKNDIRTVPGCLILSAAGVLGVSLLFSTALGRPELTLRVAQGIVGQLGSILSGLAAIFLLLVLVLLLKR